MADQEQDLDPYSSAFEQGLRRMPSGSNEAMPAALGILLGQSKSDRPEVRQASAALIGLTVRGVAYGLRRRDLEDKALTPVGLTATRSLILLLADPDARVRLTAAYWLGEIGASVDGASRLCWEDLLRCFEAGEFPLRQACGLALSRLYPGSQAAPPPLAPRLAALLEADHPELRMAAAQCLTRWGKGMQAEGSAAVQALRRSLQESDTSLRLAKASALAVVGGGDSDVVQEVLDLVGSSLASSDSHERRQAQMLLRDLGETHPAAAPAALQLLRAGGSDEPGAAGKTRWEDSLTRLVAVRDIGWSDARSARSALQVLAEALAAPNQDTRRNAISNGIRPLVCRYPGLADEVLIILERQAQAGILAGLAHGEAALREHLSSTFLDCWVEAAAVRAVVEGPPTLQPWIASPASGDRRLGRLALLRATAKRPALLPEMREMLRRTGRSVRPHVRLCTAQANEGLALLEKLQAGSPEEFNRLLDWLPDRSLAQELVGIRGRQDSHCLLPTQ